MAEPTLRRDTRFKPGVSGNPKGRPKKPSAETRHREIMTRAVNEVLGTRDGEPITAFEAMILKVRKTVLEGGKLRDLTQFVALCERLGVQLVPPKEEEQQTTGVLLVARPCETNEEWEAKYGEAAKGMTGSPPDLPGAFTVGNRGERGG